MKTAWSGVNFHRLTIQLLALLFGVFGLSGIIQADCKGGVGTDDIVISDKPADFYISGDVVDCIAIGSSITLGPNVTIPDGATFNLIASRVIVNENVEVLSGGVLSVVVMDDTLPPDPAEVAPEPDLTVATTVYGSNEFLYTGDDPIQTGVEPGTIDPVRIAVLRGKVMSHDGAPLSGVTLNILDHPELGQTLSREDGAFDLAVNGGGRLTVVYKKPGFLTAQRQVETAWQDYGFLPDVALIPLDAKVTNVDLAAPGMKVARGSVVTDADGSRQNTILFPEGITAELVLADGSTQPISTLNVRVTEFTVGENGIRAMPAELPPITAYTYAYEVSTDEAIAADAPLVQFSEPVYSYVEDFVGFPVGTAVPTGFYDRSKGNWVPSENGRVVKVLGATGDLADLDIDGDDLADDAATLAELGVTDAERTEVAALYVPGQSLWRVPLPHFTWPYDCNWPYGPPEDAEFPPGEQPEGDSCVDNPCNDAGNSVIECQNQVLRERIPAVGTGFTLNYGSNRVEGRKAAYKLEIPVSSETIPDSLKRIDLVIEVAGRRFEEHFAPAPNLSYTFIWDGKDAVGRPVQGPQPVSGKVGYAYQLVYYPVSTELAAAFGRVAAAAASGSGGGGLSVVVPGRSAPLEPPPEVVLWATWEAAIGAWQQLPASGIGGWSLDPHHSYGPLSGILYLGNGTNRNATSREPVIQTVATGLWYPYNLDFAADGSWYIADGLNDRIQKIDPDGIITTFAGGNGEGFSGDGGLAIEAQLFRPVDVAVGMDGSVYIADYGNHRVRVVTPDGFISTFAGNGIAEFSGDGGLAVDASFNRPQDVAIGPDGTVYIADLYNHRVRAVGLDGAIGTVAGVGYCSLVYDVGDGEAATDACISHPTGLWVDPGGNLYIAQGIDNYPHNRVRRVGTNGIITTIAGGVRYLGEGIGDGGPATEAYLSGPNDVVGDKEGNLYIAEALGYRIRTVASDGIIRTFAGTGLYGFSGDRGVATAARLDRPYGVAVDPHSHLYIADTHNNRIRRVTPQFPGFTYTDIAITSDDGGRLYRFDENGRHLESYDTLTGVVLYSFGYDTEGRLSSVEDRDGNVTNIERDAEGKPTAVVAPFGQRTVLGLDPNGYIERIENPAGEAVQLTYAADGLLTSLTHAKGNLYEYFYDDLGRLERAENPAGGSKALVRTETDDGHEIAVTTAEGRTTRYLFEHLPTGATRYLNTFPDGTQTEVHEFGGTREISYADGTSVTITEGPDPRFGMMSPVITSATLSTPDGLNLVIGGSRSAVLTDPADPMSLETLTTTSTVNGRTTNSVYEAATRTITETSPAGRQIVATLDEMGRIASGQEANLEPIAITYDTFGRLEIIRSGLGDLARVAALGYDPLMGFLASITNPLDAPWSILRDDAGRIKTLTRPNLESIGFTYDDNSNVASATPPDSSAHLFAYNTIDNIESYDPPTVVGTPTPLGFSYTPDADLDVITLADGTAIERDYDPTTGALSTITWPGTAGTTSFGYDPATGQLTWMSTSDGEWLTLDYDGSLPKDFTWSGTVAGTVTRSYDSDLRISGLTVQVGADERSWSYLYEDADGLLTQAGDLTLTHDPVNGLPTGTTLGPVSTGLTYTSFGEPQTLSASYDTTGLYEAAFLEYDKLGRIVRVQETVEGVSETRRYVYDEADRLDQVWVDGTLYMDLDYDANGNRTRTVYPQSSLVIDATYDAQDRLRTWGDVSYGFNDNGLLATRSSPSGTTTYDYDAHGALRSVMLDDATALTYAIDPAGRRVGKSVNGVLERGWLYQDSLTPIAELEASGAIRAVFVYGSRPHVPDYMVTGGETYRLIADVRGSVRLVVNMATGAVVQRIDYDPWGRVLADSNPEFQPFGFAGGLYDPDTGLVRFGARDYDPETGRWTAKDPVLFDSGQTNFYAYVDNDPINWVDVTGNGAAAVAWGFVEFGLIVADFYACLQVANDPCATTFDKALCATLAVAGVVLPGGGLGIAAKQGRWGAKIVSKIDTLKGKWRSGELFGTGVADSFDTVARRGGEVWDTVVHNIKKIFKKDPTPPSTPPTVNPGPERIGWEDWNP